MDNLSSLPRFRCERRAFYEVAANPDAAAWRKLEAQPLRETMTGGMPSQATTVRVGWSAEELRVLFHCEDAHIFATRTQRDAPLWEEEVVEVFVDPIGDLAAYFEIEVNPLNAVLDLVLRRNRSGFVSNVAWNCDGLRTAAQRTATAWTAELAIPFRSLVAEPPHLGSQWRANFLRIDRPPGVARELTAWSPTGRSHFHVPERFGVIEFA